jgi:hypothetical protein
LEKGGESQVTILSKEVEYGDPIAHNLPRGEQFLGPKAGDERLQEAAH